METKVREEMRDLLNQAVNIEEAEEGHTGQVALVDLNALASVIRLVQYEFKIGVQGEDILVYALNEDVKIPKEER